MPILKVQEETAGKVAAMLLQIQAIKLNTDKPFTWASVKDAETIMHRRRTSFFINRRSVYEFRRNGREKPAGILK